MLVSASAMGFTAGYFADKWLDTSPVFTLLLLLIGVAAGFWAVIKETILKKR